MEARLSQVADDPLEVIARLRAQRQPFALATVIETNGSVSAQTGAKAVIDREGARIAGWVGGGCAESAVQQAAIEALATGKTEIVDLDLDDEVLGVGMPCGGRMRVFVEPVLPKPTLWILGHGRVAECLCELGALMGFDVVVDDPLADAAHYPRAHRLLSEDLDYGALAPTADDHVIVATQHKGDHQSMLKILRGEVGSLALIASGKRSRLVLDYLRAQGLSEQSLQRVRAPAGLDLGGRTPEEIALSVISEVVLLRRGGSGRPKWSKSADGAPPSSLKPERAMRVVAKGA